MQTHITTNENTFEAKLFTKGTLKLPVGIRNDLNVQEGDRILFIKKNGSWVVTTHKQNIRQTQEYFAQLKQENKVEFTVDDFIAERRAEALKELSE